MRKLSLLIIMGAITNLMLAQTHNNVDGVFASGTKNISVKNLSHHANSSSFIIWVKDSVKAHYHKEHTETILVLEGEGEMMLGNDTVMLSKGVFVEIPPETIHSVKVTSRRRIKVLSVQAPEFMGEDRHFIEE